MTPTQIVARAIDQAGGLNKLARKMNVAPNAVAQWRDGRTLPEWFRANRLSEISGEPLATVEAALTTAHRARSERRRRDNASPKLGDIQHVTRRGLAKMALHPALVRSSALATQ